FFVGTLHVAERFCGGLTEAQRRQLFDEHVQWYRMYGMSMRPVARSQPARARGCLRNRNGTKAKTSRTMSPKRRCNHSSRR
ncbi:oxygenase MpaB family protein, partial [Mycobacterium tuberculosis]|uniref:oxygenase MpaB family protein n=1 Tax=Mycobacterium tuberculosis TaxID=1773 RepID=UPI003C6DCA76